MMQPKLSEKELKIMEEQYGGMSPGGTGKSRPLAIVLIAIKERGKEVVKVKDNEYKTICPIHKDGKESKPSLHIKCDPDTETVFVKCFGCEGEGKTQNEIWDSCLTAWGLTPDDLKSKQRKIIAEYDYTDKDGNVLYQNVRYEPKNFSQRRPDGKGDWVWSLNGIKRVLYNLPELVKPGRPGKSVFFTEGEKDVGTLRDKGYLATTSGASTSWRPELAADLKGCNVVILPHNDPAGVRYADTVAHDLYGVAVSIKIVKLPVGQGEDVTDYFEQDGTNELLDELVSKTPKLIKAPVVQKNKLFNNKEFGSMKTKETYWLWYNRIPLGMLSLIIGNQDVGKSVLSLFMAGVVSTGESWPDAPNEKIPVGSVLILSAEDDPCRTIKPRLTAAGVDGNKIFNLESMTEILPDGQAKTRRVTNLTTDLDVLADAIDEIGDVRLIIIDPITAYAGGKKENSNAGVRDYLNPLIELAASRNVAIVGLGHLNKDAKKEALYRTLGSIAWTAAARAVWLVAFDPKVDGRRVFLPIKSNLSRGRTGLAFTLVNTNVEVEGNSRGYPTCKFESGIVEMTPDDALDPESRKKATKKIDQCVEWLEEFLLAGPRMSTDIFAAGLSNSMSKRTIERAKDKLSVKATQIRESSKIVGWEWALLT